MDIGTSETVFASAGALVGGIVLKLVEIWVKKTEKRRGETDKLKDQYRRDAHDADARGDKLSKEVDDWKQKYFDTYLELGKLQNEITLLRGQMALICAADKITPPTLALKDVTPKTGT